MSQIQTAEQITPLDEFVTECYERIEKWEAADETYDRFLAANGPEAASAYGAFFADLRMHLAALEEPAKIVGREYEPSDLLIDLRHLRDLTKTNIARRGGGMARRHTVPRGKIRWGVLVDEGASIVSGQTYQAITDDLAGRLARAIKQTAALA